jgi:hypothetical protein
LFAAQSQKHRGQTTTEAEQQLILEIEPPLLPDRLAGSGITLHDIVRTSTSSMPAVCNCLQRGYEILYVGRFDTPEEASKLAERLAKRLRGKLSYIRRWRSGRRRASANR